MAEGQWPDIMAMCEWLQDPANAEPSATFPVDAARVSGPGVYTWHGDAVASALVSAQLPRSRIRCMWTRRARIHRELVEPRARR